MKHTSPNTSDLVVMLRHLPNRASADRVIDHLKDLGFSSFDYVYMPIDRLTRVNKGYAFIRFHDTETAESFSRLVAGTQLAGSSTSKVLMATFATNQQEAIAQNRYRKRRLI